MGARNVALEYGCRRLQQNSGGSGGGVDRGRWGEGLGSHLWSISARSWDRGGLGGGVGR
jgi:hypothetical protein